MQESQSNVPFIIMAGSNNHSKKKKTIWESNSFIYSIKGDNVRAET